MNINWQTEFKWLNSKIIFHSFAILVHRQLWFWHQWQMLSLKCYTKQDIKCMCLQNNEWSPLHELSPLFLCGNQAILEILNLTAPWSWLPLFCTLNNSICFPRYHHLQLWQKLHAVNAILFQMFIEPPSWHDKLIYNLILKLFDIGSNLIYFFHNKCRIDCVDFIAW